MQSLNSQQKYINTDGTIRIQRIAVASKSNIDGMDTPELSPDVDQSVKDAFKETVDNSKALALKVSDNIRRVTEIESSMNSMQYIEFEQVLGTAGATVSLQHRFNTPVRYFVTLWTRSSSADAYPTAAPVLIMDSASDSNVLVLKSYVAGKAVIRVEKAQHGIIGF